MRATESFPSTFSEFRKRGGFIGAKLTQQRKKDATTLDRVSPEPPGSAPRTNLIVFP